MPNPRGSTGGLCTAAITLRAHQLLSTVCVVGGAECPLLDEAEAKSVIALVRSDPTVTIRLTSPADEIAHFTEGINSNPVEVLNRKRDLDVLQRLGLVPGAIRRARYLYTLLFERIATLDGLCAYDTPGWEGCALARSGAYERIRKQGWSAIVYQRPADEIANYRTRSAEQIAHGARLFVRPHHLMCLACWYAGGAGQGPRPNDMLYEILLRIRTEPSVPITLVEGCCQACECCEGFHPQTGRCVHSGGLIRDYKKDLDVLQRLGLMPGTTLPACKLFDLLFARIPSTRDICAYGDGVVRSEEWRICGNPNGNPGYEATRRTGLF
ncbi:MAG: hypothetical protein ACUVX8_04905 [Candidatus Zipacnadales bacterium]